MDKVKRQQRHSTDTNNVSLLIEINLYQKEYKSLLKGGKKALANVPTVRSRVQ